MDDAFETDDAAYIARALGVLAWAERMKDTVKKTGLSRK